MSIPSEQPIHFPSNLFDCLKKAQVEQRHACPLFNLSAWIADAAKPLVGSQKTPHQLHSYLITHACEHAALQKMPTAMRQEVVFDLFKAILACSKTA